jgi:glutamine synthetase
MIDMVKRDYLPAVGKFVAALSEALKTKKELSIPAVYESDVCVKLSNLMTETYETVSELENEEKSACACCCDKTSQANCYSERIIPLMEALREKVDAMEPLTASEYWPVPTYGELTYYVD